jgi:(p)ppGpp synthase/HD superfamily hydrolase
VCQSAAASKCFPEDWFVPGEASDTLTEVDKAKKMHLTQRFEQALDYATELHKDQERKGSGVPYLAHLMGVAALVMEDGGDEDQAIAALLHDAPEDQGGRETLEEIRRRFGDRVAAIVDGCTDTYETPKPPWRPRKEAYLEHLRTAPVDVRRVSLADKLYNARSILIDLHRSGSTVWERFNGGKEGTLWYYHALVQTFGELDDSPLVTELDWIVRKIDEFLLQEMGLSSQQDRV